MPSSITKTVSAWAGVNPKILASGYTPVEALAAFNAKMFETPLPEGVHLKVGGENEETNQSFMEMGLAFLAGLALMFVVLVLAFNSMRYSLYLILSVFLSLIGVFGGLTITGQTLSFSSLLGIIRARGRDHQPRDHPHGLDPTPPQRRYA